MKVFGYVVLGFIVLSILGGMCGKLGQKSFDQAQLLKEVNQSSSISVLVAARAIHRVDIWTGGVSLIVGPAFYPLSFENKTATVKTVADLVGPERGGDHFLLYDWRTNKNIGAWRGENGLNLE